MAQGEYESTDAEEAVLTRAKNKEKGLFLCLGGCNKEFKTDRCHRICRICRRRNERNGNYSMNIYNLGSSPRTSGNAIYSDGPD